MVAPVRYQRGETIKVAILAQGAADADLNVVAAVSAVLKPAARGGVVPAADVEAAATFDVELISKSAGSDPGWALKIPSAQSQNLTPGLYVTNGVLQMQNGDVEKIDPLLLQIEESTS